MVQYRLVDHAAVWDIDPQTGKRLPDKVIVRGAFAYVKLGGRVAREMYGDEPEFLVDASLIPKLESLRYDRWHVTTGGYPSTGVTLPGGRQRGVQIHHVVRVGPYPSGFTRDHLNRDPLDNRAANVGFATKRWQSVNRCRVINSPYPLGVHTTWGRFCARVWCPERKENQYGPLRDTPEEAMSDYANACISKGIPWTYSELMRTELLM